MFLPKESNNSANDDIKYWNNINPFMTKVPHGTRTNIGTPLIAANFTLDVPYGYYPSRGS